MANLKMDSIGSCPNPYIAGMMKNDNTNNVAKKQKPMIHQLALDLSSTCRIPNASKSPLLGCESVVLLFLFAIYP
jgi:hypothetical protein